MIPRHQVHLREECLARIDGRRSQNRIPLQESDGPFRRTRPIGCGNAGSQVNGLAEIDFVARGLNRDRDWHRCGR